MKKILICFLIVLMFPMHVHAYGKQEMQGVDYLQKCLVEREPMIEFDIVSKKHPSKGYAKAIYQKALCHTAFGNEGDYLKWNILSCHGRCLTEKTGDNYCTHFSYMIRYRTTKEQEKAISRFVKSASHSWAGKDEKEKLMAIREYVCQNLSYDAKTFSLYDGFTRRRAVVWYIP